MPKHSSHSRRKVAATRGKSSSRHQVPSGAPGQGDNRAAKPRPARAARARRHSKSFSEETRSLPAVAIFARAAVPGKTKTRLIPALGPHGAAQFHLALASDTFRKVAGLAGRAACYAFTAGGTLSMASPVLERRRQRGRDLAERLNRAFAELLPRHSRAVIIGTDSPTLAPGLLRLALEELRATDAVLGPCPDGGYYLIGLRRIVPGLFSGLRLETEFAFADTLSSLLAHGLSCSVLEPCPDVDRPEDLAALKKLLANNPAARRLAPHTWRFLSKMG